MGQIGRHSADHSRALAESDVPARLLAVYMEAQSEDLKTKAKRALKSIVQMCSYLSALEPSLQVSFKNLDSSSKCAKICCSLVCQNFAS